MTWSKTREVEPNIIGNHSYTTTCRRIGWKGWFFFITITVHLLKRTNT